MSDSGTKLAGEVSRERSVNRIIRSRAPLRVSFGGGGTDVTPYLEERGGAVLNATINMFAYASLTPTRQKTLRIHSIDYDRTIEYALDAKVVEDQQLRLAQTVVEYFRTHHGLGENSEGLEVRLHNDAPPGSGLGSSSAITVALIGALSAAVNLTLDAYGIAELAYRLERVEAGIKGGKQDQYAAAFGGFNFIEFKGPNTVVHPLRLNPSVLNELQYSMVFAYVGGQRFSGDLIQKQIGNFVAGNVEAIAAMDEQKELAYAMKDALLTGKLEHLGTLLDQAWMSKRRMADGISNSRIDAVYVSAREAGALGGKVSGAGGGGFMMFLCRPENRFTLQSALKKMDCSPADLSFTNEGLAMWQV